MSGHTLPEISCNVCGKPIDLAVDLYADENGKIVHQSCYVKYITSSCNNPRPPMAAA